MTTTEALVSGAGTIVETAAGAVTDIAEKAKDKLVERKESHRGRTLLIGAALLGAAAAAFRFLRGRRSEENVIDLTQDPVKAPESLSTP